MRSKSGPQPSAEQIVREIRRHTRKSYSSEEKIRIVLEGLRREYSIAELCRRECIAQGLYYRWSKEFLEAGKKRLSGDTERARPPQAKRGTFAAILSDLKEALADVLQVDGNPMDDIELLGDPDKNLVIIMKDGKIYKNTLGQTPEQKKKALIDRSIKRAALSPGRVNQPTKTGNAFYFCAIHQAYHFMDGKLPFAGLRSQTSAE